MKRSNIIGLILGIIVVVIAVALICWFAIRPVPTMIQGQVEVTSYRIASKAAGRLDTVAVSEGQRVSKGELLFVLNSPEAEARLMQAEGARDAAGAQSEKAHTGARPQEIYAAYNQWKQAETALELAQKNYERARNLFESGVIPAQKYDEASANLQAMKNSVAMAQAQYSMAVEGARSEEVRAASAVAKQAKGAVSEVEAYLDDTRQYAPVDGEISTVIAREGELVGAGFPVITLLDTNDLWITFNIRENLLPKIKIGSEMKAYVPGLDRSIHLKIYYMAPQAEYATWTATRTRGEFDIRTFEVRARPDGIVEGLRPGMTVSVNWDELQ